MSDVQTTVLLVDDNPAGARLIQEALAGCASSPLRVEWVRRLAEALDRLGRGGVEAVLLAPILPDGRGVEAFSQVLQAAPDALILVLSGETVEGFKDPLDALWLPRALHYAIGQQALRGELRICEADFRTMSDASPLGIFVSDPLGNCTYTNAAYQEISGQTLAQTLGTNWTTAIYPDDRQRVLAEWRAAAMGDEPFQTEYRFLRKDKSIVWTRVSSAPMLDGMEMYGRVKTVEDISERKMSEFALRTAEDALFEEKERAQVTLNSIGDAVLTTDLSGKVTYLNVVAETMTGWPWDEALGRPLLDVFRIVNGVTRETAVSPAQRAIDEDKTVGLAVDSVLIRRDGSESAIEDSSAPIHDRDGHTAGAVIVFHDVSESRFMALKMAHLAQHDFLTGLPNRILLTERLSQAIGLAHRHHKQVGLLFLDLDSFKHVNDSLGHAIGDQLLQSVAERLTAGVRTTDTVCRQGGDEFVILLAEIEQPQDAANVAEKLLIAFAEPHHIGSNDLHVTLSIGISVYPDDSSDADTLMQNADTAMYHAKESGRDNYQFFKPEMNTRAVHRLFVESSLRRALKRGEFLLYYQSQGDLLSGAMTGVEALVRWQDPELGLISPGQFVPIAEECGLIVQIGRWVLREACRQVKAWLDAGLHAVPVAVNVSAVEFRHKGFVDGVALILRETGLPANYLELELTESLLMRDAVVSASLLQSLKAMGVNLAIDDFGTGYSSLSYLKRFPIDTLKIDQSFVRDIVTDANGSTIVSAVIGMGRNLRLRVIAEGVETQEQLDFLLSRQCVEGQGTLFSAPLSADDFVQLLANGTAGWPVSVQEHCIT